MPRKRIGEPVAVSEPPKMSKYAAKKAARRHETNEQKAERLLGKVEYEVTETVIKDTGEFVVKKEKDGKKHVQGAVTFDVYNSRKMKAHKAHLDRQLALTSARMELEKRLKEAKAAEAAESERFKRYKKDMSSWYQTGVETQYMKEYEGDND